MAVDLAGDMDEANETKKRAHEPWQFRLDE
jgi:hypothetical protein